MSKTRVHTAKILGVCGCYLRFPMMSEKQPKKEVVKTIDFYRTHFLLVYFVWPSCELHMYMRRTERKGKERRRERMYMCAKRRKRSLRGTRTHTFCYPGRCPRPVRLERTTQSPMSVDDISSIANTPWKKESK